MKPPRGFPSRGGVLLRADVRNVDATDCEDVARDVVVRRRPVFVNRFHPGQVGAAQFSQVGSPRFQCNK